MANTNMASVYDLRPHADAFLSRRGGGLHPPSEVLKDWPKPNHVDPEERGWEAPIVLLIIMGITFLVYCARIWARVVVAKNHGLDDLLISLAMLPLLGLCISAILAMRVYGFQWHAWDQTAVTHVTSRQITMSIELNYLVSTTLIKISILFFYRRITGSFPHRFVSWVYGSIVLCVIYFFTFAVLIVFTCSPVIGFFHLFDNPWRLSNKLHCNNEGAIVVACAVISTVQDLVICMLPIFLIWNLQITKRQKFGLCGIFSMGLITCLCGVMRTYYATYVYFYTYDITWYAYPGWVWTCLEAQLAVICASAPALKVFFRRYFKTNYSGYTKSGSNKTPIPLSRSRRGDASLFQSTHSAARSYVVAGGYNDSEVPHHGIKVSQGLHVSVEEGDNVSQRSYASTTKLTAPPMADKAGWKGNMCAALKPGSQGGSRSYSRDSDLERGPPQP